MIITDHRAPAWLQELARFIPLKNLLFLHGNIYDRMSFPRAREGAEPAWVESDLRHFLGRLLTDLDYEVVGIVDPVDGLSFLESEMEELHRSLLSGPQAEPGASADGPRRGRGARLPSAVAGLDPVLDQVRQAVAGDRVPVAYVFLLASRLLVSASHLSSEELVFFTKVLKASLDSKEVRRPHRRWRNLLIFASDKLNDLPSFLFLGNPRARSIHLKLPDTRERERFFVRNCRAFHDADREPPAPELFAALTEGLTHYELQSLISLSLAESIPVRQLDRLCERYKYGIHESEWNKIGREHLDEAGEVIRERVKGQNAAVDRMLDIIKRARVGLAAGAGHRSSRPRGVLFFAGPTGVGKTEMAKAAAKLLFGQEDRCIRFDMSEYAVAQADQKLLGAPPGYVGYQEGGQLTNAIKERPFSILLFDEIEKAHGSIFDKFLQILDDGRLTDGKGETIYFSECIIIFTSNLGAAGPSTDEDGSRQLVTPDMPYKDMQEQILKAISDYFNFELRRPEIYNRFGDSFVVFDFIRPPVDREIVEMFLERLIRSADSERGIELVVEPPVRDKLVELGARRLVHGGRGIRTAVDEALVNPLNRLIFDHDVGQQTRLILTGLEVEQKDAAERYELSFRQEPR